MLIWSRGLYRQALAVRLYCGQLFGSSLPGSAAKAILEVSRQAKPRPAANAACGIIASSVNARAAVVGSSSSLAEPGIHKRLSDEREGSMNVVAQCRLRQRCGDPSSSSLLAFRGVALCLCRARRGGGGRPWNRVGNGDGVERQQPLYAGCEARIPLCVTRPRRDRADAPASAVAPDHDAVTFQTGLEGSRGGRGGRSDLIHGTDLVGAAAVVTSDAWPVRCSRYYRCSRSAVKKP